MWLSENIAFILKPSRMYKFYLLFGCIILLVFAAMLVSGLDDVWVSKPEYLQNVIKDLNSKVCAKYSQQETTDLGKTETFDESSLLFWLIGIGFGTSMALTGSHNQVRRS